jgi:hypothetical protein
LAQYASKRSTHSASTLINRRGDGLFMVRTIAKRNREIKPLTRFDVYAHDWLLKTRQSSLR